MKFLLCTCSACGGELEIKLDEAGPYVECVCCGLDQETLRRRIAQPQPANERGSFAHRP